jgi:phospholipase/carboxylesterase
MSESISLSGPSRPPSTGGKPRKLVILLHGIGANGDDLIGLAPYWAQALPEAEFLAPNAPYPCDMAPFGYQWFSLQDRSPGPMLAGVRRAAPILDGFIDEALRARGLSDADLALVGFSQGTMMSLHVAPRRNAPCAGVVGYSGALLGPDLLAEEAVSKPEMLLIHGAADEVVSVAALPAAEQALKSCGMAVSAIVRPGLGHGIDPEGIALGSAFLKEKLG